MIIEALRRSLVRWLRPRATSVSPKFKPTSYLNSFSNVKVVWSKDIDPADWAVKPIPPGPYVDPRQRGAESVGSKLAREMFDERARPGISPPPDPALDGWTWAKWKREINAGAVPGWSFCRFANRIGPDQVGFVFGIVRGSFGVWRQPFQVCHDDDGQSSKVLSFITHLRSGLGIGIFADRETAVQAAELADQVCRAWGTLDPDDRSTWDEIYNRTRMAWNGLGIRCDANQHCHDEVGGTYGVHIIAPDAGRPEKLS